METPGQNPTLGKTPTLTLLIFIQLIIGLAWLEFATGYRLDQTASSLFFLFCKLYYIEYMN